MKTDRLYKYGNFFYKTTFYTNIGKRDHLFPYFYFITAHFLKNLFLYFCFNVSRTFETNQINNKSTPKKKNRKNPNHI